MKNQIRTTELRSSKQKLTIFKEVQGPRSQSFKQSQSPQKVSPQKQSPQKLSPLKQGVFFNAQGPARPKSRYNPGVKSSTRINEQLSSVTLHRKVISDSSLPKLSPIKPRNEIKLDMFRQKMPLIKWITCRTQAGKSSDKITKINQDSFISIQQFTDNSSLFAVCDGHGQDGHKCSQFVKEALPRFLKLQMQSSTSIQDALQKSFIKTNQQLCCNEEMVCQFSGSTTVLTLLVDRIIYCANVGDSRAIIGRQNNGHIQAISLSNDHKPELPGEKKRIESNGGRVEPFQDYDGSMVGPYRVWLKDKDVPGLAMSRSFGDQVAASVGVISEPEITSHQLNNNDLFMVIASDGVWEFLSNEQVVDMVYPHYYKDESEIACNKIIKESTRLWKLNDDVIDDITCLIIFFNKDDN